MRVPAVAFLALVAACGGSDDPRAQGPAYSLDSCPELVEGMQSFASGELTYDVLVRLPAETEGAPLVFLFHHLGGNAADIATGLGADELVELGAVVVAPESASGAELEWETGIAPADNRDLLMFHDLLGCARRQLGIDMDRVWASGMSAGALWVSWLIFHAADWLTAAAPFSGGYTLYPPPAARSIPALVTWGGENDIYSEFNFELATADLLFYLTDFGHPVIACEHDLGHDIPAQAPAMLTQFFGDLRWGEPVPAPADTLAGLPSWCHPAE